MIVFKQIKQTIFNDERGSILLMSILILTGILAATLTAANLALSGILLSGTQVRSTQAYYAADAGIEQSLYWSRASSTATSTLENDAVVLASSTLSNDASYSVGYSTWGVMGTSSITGTSTRFGSSVRSFTSAGEFNNLRRTVEAQFGFVPFERIIAPKCDSAHLDLCFNETQCESIGAGFWYTYSNVEICSSTPPIIEPAPVVLPDYNGVSGICSFTGVTYCKNKNDCEYYGGFWYFSKCNLNPCNCDNETNCGAASGYWYNDVCNENPL